MISVWGVLHVDVAREGGCGGSGGGLRLGLEEGTIVRACVGRRRSGSMLQVERGEAVMGKESTKERIMSLDRTMREAKGELSRGGGTYRS